MSMKLFENSCNLFTVANGLHRKTNNQYDAHKVAFMALKMIETCAKHSTHDGKHIQVSL